MSRTGTICAIRGNLLTVTSDQEVRQHEVAWATLGAARLQAEVVRVRGAQADLQVFESVSGLRVGDRVEFTGDWLSVELGPGLLGQLYDGLQRPLRRVAAEHGFFLPRGVAMPALDGERVWDFAPAARVGDLLQAGDVLGHVPEGLFRHHVFVPFDWPGVWRVEAIRALEALPVGQTLATLSAPDGQTRTAELSFRWPVKRPIRLYRERLAPTEPLVTQVRMIDSLFPVARGGTWCMPGPFGSGKTVLQQLISRYAQVDVVVIAACGERAGEVVETIRDFPSLPDPRTGRALMERTILICNTSSMPVAAREASVYTAVTLAEYYRQMGLDVLLLADSTTRWAQALRERSGRLEEIPGEEAYPASLESTIAEFYERAGRVRLRDGRIGTVTIGGTVSPAGGNFEEPVTQATLKAVGAYLALSRERADARRFPALDPLESWSRYDGADGAAVRREIRELLQKAHEIGQMLLVVGEEGTSLADFVLYGKAEFFDAVYLQQNAFDPVDAASSEARQRSVLSVLLEILRADLRLPDRDAARAFFHRLRQIALDWNGLAWDSEPCRARERELRAWLESHRREDPAVAPGRRRAWVEPELDSDFRRRRAAPAEDAGPAGGGGGESRAPGPG